MTDDFLTEGESERLDQNKLERCQRRVPGGEGEELTIYYLMFCYAEIFLVLQQDYLTTWGKNNRVIENKEIYEKNFKYRKK